MEETTFWYLIWKLVAIVICTLVISMASCTANRHYQTRALIENANVDPIEAHCALNSDTLRDSACIVRSTK
jgi:hypothetical protein